MESRWKKEHDADVGVAATRPRIISVLAAPAGWVMKTVHCQWCSWNAYNFPGTGMGKYRYMNQAIR